MQALLDHLQVTRQQLAAMNGEAIREAMRRRHQELESRLPQQLRQLALAELPGHRRTADGGRLAAVIANYLVDAIPKEATAAVGKALEDEHAAVSLSELADQFAFTSDEFQAFQELAAEPQDETQAPVVDALGRRRDTYLTLAAAVCELELIGSRQHKWQACVDGITGRRAVRQRTQRKLRHLEHQSACRDSRSHTTDERTRPALPPPLHLLTPSHAPNGPPCHGPLHRPGAAVRRWHGQVQDTEGAALTAAA